MDQPSNSADIAGGRPFSVGVTLREAREKLGLSVADVANRLKFAPRQIEALEEDNFARLPEIAFVRGFVRSYARLLQLDPQPLLAALPQPVAQPAIPTASPANEVRFPDSQTARRQNYLWLAAGLAVAILLGLFVWMNDSPPQAPALTQVQPEAITLPASEVIATSSHPVAVPTLASSAPVAAPTAAPPEKMPAPVEKPASVEKPAPPEKPVVGPPVPPSVKAAKNVVKVPPPEQGSPASQAAPIRLAFDQDSWIEVTDKNGTYLMAQLNKGGTERRIRGTPPFFLTIGNASSVRLYYQGKEIDLAPFNRSGVAHLTLE